MFEAGKTYKTKDGRDFRVYATDGVEPFSVHGAIKRDDGTWHCINRTKDGKENTYRDSDSDLVPDPPPLPQIDIAKPCRTRDGRAVANLRKSGCYIVGDIVNRATGVTIVDVLWRPNGRHWAEKETTSDIIQCTVRPWTRADVPWPRPEFRLTGKESGNWLCVARIHNHGIQLSDIEFVSWATLSSNWQYSVDGGTTWLACEVAE